MLCCSDGFGKSFVFSDSKLDIGFESSLMDAGMWVFKDNSNMFATEDRCNFGLTPHWGDIPIIA